MKRYHQLVMSEPWFQVDAREFEEPLAEHPNVAEAAVVFAPNDPMGAMEAFVVLEEGGSAEQVLSRLPLHLTPRQIRFGKSLPN